jgi:hypothetical protein
MISIKHGQRSLFSEVCDSIKNNFPNNNMSATISGTEAVVVSGHQGQVLATFKGKYEENGKYDLYVISGVNGKGTCYHGVLNIAAKVSESLRMAVDASKQKTMLAYKNGLVDMLENKFANTNISGYRTIRDSHVLGLSIRVSYAEEICSVEINVGEVKNHIIVRVPNVGIVLAGHVDSEEMCDTVESQITRYLYKRNSKELESLSNIVTKLIGTFSISTELKNDTLTIYEHNLFETDGVAICHIKKHPSAYTIYQDAMCRDCPTIEIEEELAKVLKAHFKNADTTIDICDDDLLKIAKVALENKCNLKDALTILINR